MSVTGATVLLGDPAPTLAASRSYTNGSYPSGSTWTVPYGVSSVTVSVYGGGAGTGGRDGAAAGSGGVWGYVQATLSVSAGDTIGVYPGDSGANGSGCVTGYGGGAGGADSYPSGNYNGGTGGAAGTAGCSGGGGGGGAASVVTRNGAIQLIAGGAGGGGGANNVSAAPGGTTGSLSANTYGGTGANGWDCSNSDDGGGAGGGGGGSSGGNGGGTQNDGGECKGLGGSAGSNYVVAGATSVTNTTSSSSAETVTISYSATSVSTPALASGSDTGSSSSDSITSATSLVFTGTATGGATVQLKVDGANTGSTCTADVSTGAWSCTTGTLAAGTRSITATATVDGEAKTSSAASVVVDTTAPTPSVTSTSLTSAAPVSVQSSETGTAYLVSTSVSVSNLASITTAADDRWNSVTVSAANSATSMSTTGLSDGTYRLYAVDTAGNLSAASSGTVTIDSVLPTVTLTAATITNLSSATVRSSETGTAYLVKSTVSVTDLASITSSADNTWNSVAVSAADTNTSLPAAGLLEGTYVAYAKDAAGNLSAVSVSSVTVTLTDQTGFAITGAPATLAYAGTVTLGTSGGNGSGAVSWATTSPSVCSVNAGSGLVTALAGSGTCSIAATKAADTSYYAAAANVDITAVKANQTALSVSGTSSGAYGASISLSTSGGSTNGVVTWNSGGSTACSVGSSGVVSVTSGTGTCSVTATMAGNDLYEPVVSSAFVITVSKASQAALTVTSTSVTYGDTLALTFTGGSGTGAVTWTKVSGTCSVSGTTLTPGDAGSACVVRVSRAGDADYASAASADTSITVARAAQSALTVTSTDVTHGQSLSLTATGGTGSGALTWTKVSGTCTVSGSTLTPGDAGSACVVRVTKAQDTNYLARDSADTTITVARATQSPLVVTSTSATHGSTLWLTTSGGSGTGAVTWTKVSGTCTVSGSALTPGDAGSSCVVRATKAQDTNHLVRDSADTAVTTAQAAQDNLVVTTVNAVHGSTLSLATTGGSGTGAVTWTKVSGTCTVTGSALTPGDAGSSCVVKATKAADTNYLVVSSVNTTVTVGKGTQSGLMVTSQSTFTTGSSLVLTATGGESTGGLSWAVTSGTCSLSGSTLTSARGGVTCVVTVTRAGDTNWFTDSATQTVTVNKIAQTLTFRSSPPGPANPGMTYTVSVESDAFLAPTVTVANQSASVCSINSGVVTFVAVGTCLVSASQPGNDVYSSAAASQTVNVVAASPATTVAPPASGGAGGGVVPAVTTTIAGTTKATAPTTTVPPATTTTTTTTLPPTNDPGVPNMGMDGQLPELAEGETVAIVRGQLVKATVETKDGQLTVTLPNDVSIVVGSGSGASGTAKVSADGVLRAFRESQVEVAAQGLQPGTTYTVFMFSEPLELARGSVGGSGRVGEIVTLPKIADLGSHTLQVNGVGPDAEVVSVSLGIKVIEKDDNTVAAVIAISLAILLALLGGRPVLVGRRRRRAADSPSR